MTIDVTVVLYFLLFLFIFLYEITPPIPQILPIIAGVLSFADFILISFVFHSKNKCRQGSMKAQSKVKPAC